MTTSSWRAFVDPECPDVILKHDEAATNPLDLLDTLTIESLDWEKQHRAKCERCSTYGTEEETPGDMTGQ